MRVTIDQLPAIDAREFPQHIRDARPDEIEAADGYRIPVVWKPTNANWPSARGGLRGFLLCEGCYKPCLVLRHLDASLWRCRRCLKQRFGLRYFGHKTLYPLNRVIFKALRAEEARRRRRIRRSQWNAARRPKHSAPTCG